MKHKRYTTERERNFEQLLDRYKLALNARCVFWFGGNAEKAKDAYQIFLRCYGYRWIAGGRI